MTPAEPHVHATRYEVSLLPLDDRKRRHFTVYVEWRGHDRWAVTDGHGSCLGTDGDWSHESPPAARRDAWLDEHRFDLDTALQLAKATAPTVTVNGFTATQVLEHLTGEPVTTHVNTPRAICWCGREIEPGENHFLCYPGMGDQE